MKIIEVSHLNKKYGDFTAVKDISFHVKEGELFGFLGINGAGKSTTIHMLTTLFPPNAGTAHICNHRLGKDNQEIRKCIGVVQQQNSLDDKLSVRENLLIRGSLYENSRSTLQHREKEVCKLLGLQEIAAKRYAHLSGGQKRRCEIAAALMHEPRILFLDEPTTGLDPATRQSVWTCIEQLQKNRNMTVFLTTHYMEEAAKAAHIAVIDQGELLEYGTPYELKDRHAKDRLILIAAKQEALAKLLDSLHIPYQRDDQRFLAELNSTMDALHILPAVQPYIEGFEVLQGTMDDLFLNITGKTLEEEIAQ